MIWRGIEEQMSILRCFFQHELGQERQKPWLLEFRAGYGAGYPAENVFQSFVPGQEFRAVGQRIKGGVHQLIGQSAVESFREINPAIKEDEVGQHEAATPRVLVDNYFHNVLRQFRQQFHPADVGSGIFGEDIQEHQFQGLLQDHYFILIVTPFECIQDFFAGEGGLQVEANQPADGFGIQPFLFGYAAKAAEANVQHFRHYGILIGFIGDPGRIPDHFIQQLGGQAQ